MSFFGSGVHLQITVHSRSSTKSYDNKDSKWLTCFHFHTWQLGVSMTFFDTPVTNNGFLVQIHHAQ